MVKLYRTEIVAIIMLLLTLSVGAFLGKAETNVSVGVKAGEWIKYNISGPSDTPGVAENYWLNATVKDVSGTYIWVSLETNSSSVGNQSSVGVDISYDCWIDGSWPFIAPANLTTGNVIPGGPSAIVNDTTQHFGRDAAHLRIESTEETSDWYWDRQTGVLLELSGTTADGPIAYTMDSNNIWSGNTSGLPDIGVWGWLIAAIFIVIAGVLLGAVIMTRRKKPAAVPPPPQYQPPPPPPPPPP